MDTKQELQEILNKLFHLMSEEVEKMDNTLWMKLYDSMKKLEEVKNEM